MEKEIKITPPEGYEIDKENSTFECIKFKQIKPIKPKRFIDDETCEIDGYFIDELSRIQSYSAYNIESNYNIFATEKLAKAALAMARLSQIRKYDKRFTEVNSNSYLGCCVIHRKRVDNKFQLCISYIPRTHLTEKTKIVSFETDKEANLFLNENKELLLDYFTIND